MKDTILPIESLKKAEKILEYNLKAESIENNIIAHIKNHMIVLKKQTQHLQEQFEKASYVGLELFGTSHILKVHTRRMDDLLLKLDDIKQKKSAKNTDYSFVLDELGCLKGSHFHKHITRQQYSGAFFVFNITNADVIKRKGEKYLDHIVRSMISFVLKKITDEPINITYLPHDNCLVVFRPHLPNKMDSIRRSHKLKNTIETFCAHGFEMYKPKLEVNVNYGVEFSGMYDSKIRDRAVFQPLSLIASSSKEYSSKWESLVVKCEEFELAWPFIKNQGNSLNEEENIGTVKNEKLKTITQPSTKSMKMNNPVEKTEEFLDMKPVDLEQFLKNNPEQVLPIINVIAEDIESKGQYKINNGYILVARRILKKYARKPGKVGSSARKALALITIN